MRIVDQKEWNFVTDQMHEKGFATLSKVLTEEQCNELIQGYNDSGAYRKTVVMERCHFGLGEYKYFDHPLPDIIQQIRTRL